MVVLMEVLMVDFDFSSAFVSAFFLDGLVNWFCGKGGF